MSLIHTPVVLVSCPYQYCASRPSLHHLFVYVFILYDTQPFVRLNIHSWLQNHCSVFLFAFSMTNSSFCMAQSSLCTENHILSDKTHISSSKISIPSVCLNLQKDILETYQQSLSWSQSFSVQHGNVTVDLSNACLADDVCKFCAPAQPKNLPNGLIYRFDTCFSGKAGWKSLKK